MEYSMPIFMIHGSRWFLKFDGISLFSFFFFFFNIFLSFPYYPFPYLISSLHSTYVQPLPYSTKNIYLQYLYIR